MLLILILAFFLFLTIILLFFWIIGFALFLFYDFKNKVFFAPTDKKILIKFFSEFPFESNKKFYDLGSGDGRVVFLAAQKNLFAFGIENNPLLYFFSKIKKRFLKIDNAFFIRKDFRKIDLSDADYVYLYLLPSVLEELEEKIFKETKSNCVIISFSFPFSRKKPDEIFLEKFFIYRKS